jgi:hypothetical protein
MRRRCRTPLVWLVLLGLLAGCQSLPAGPPGPVGPPAAGAVALRFTGTVPPYVGLAQGSTPPLATAVTPVAGGRLLVLPGPNRTLMLGAGRVYLSADFIVQNQGNAPVSRLALLAYGHPRFDAASPISDARLASGQRPLATFVPKLHPTHALAYAGVAGGRQLVGREGMSDFFALREGELPALPSALEADTLYPYGFLVAGGALIPPGGEGRVTVAFSFPAGSRPAASLERFTWNGLLVELPTIRLAQAAEERHPSGWRASVARMAGRTNVELVVLGAGERIRPAGVRCDQLVPLSDVRLAGRHADDPRYVGLLPATEARPPSIDGCAGEGP